MSDFVPIRAFNNNLDFTEAFNWDAARIIRFIEDVANTPSTFGVSNDVKTRLGYLRDNINSLRKLPLPSGTNFLSPSPEQQFLRGGNPLQVLQTNTIRWPANDTEKQYFIIFDLLGAFLSFMGPAPSGATAKNYFLPLLVVYTRWCIALGRGKKTNPQTTQITWGNNDGGDWCFLGSSVAGFNQSPATYKTLARVARHGYLANVLQVPYVSIDDSPEKDRFGPSGTAFGNCGETYPFLHILWDPKLNFKCFGIALEVSKIGTQYNGQSYWQEVPSGAMKAPCANCQQLMDWYGVLDRLEAFKLWL